MLQAMTTSRGSMCTIHARTPAGVSDRIIELALSHGREMTADQARRMAGNAPGPDRLRHRRGRDRDRRPQAPVRLARRRGHRGGDGNRITTTTVFGPGPDGRAAPRHLPERIRDQLAAGRVRRPPALPLIEAGAGAWRRPRTTRLGRRADPPTDTRPDRLASGGGLRRRRWCSRCSALVGTRRPTSRRAPAARLAAPALARPGAETPAERRRHQAVLIFAGLAGAVLAFLLTGLPIVGPAGRRRGARRAVAVHRWQGREARRIARIEAVGEWARRLKDVSATGHGLQQADRRHGRHRARGDRRGGTRARRPPAGRLDCARGAAAVRRRDRRPGLRPGGRRADPAPDRPGRAAGRRAGSDRAAQRPPRWPPGARSRRSGPSRASASAS